MLTPDQLAAIKARHSGEEFTSARQIHDDLEALINGYERLTRHNQRMGQALAQLSDWANWRETNEEYSRLVWRGAESAPRLAERALVEDG